MPRRFAKPFVVVASGEDVGDRADVVIARHTPGLSRRIARRAGLAGSMTVNERVSRPSTIVGVGDRIGVHSVAAGESAPTTVEIVLATDDLIYVDKPAGMHTVALALGEPGCLATCVIDQYPECAAASTDPRDGGALHRLDRDTSGLVAFARSRDAWQRGRVALTGGGARKRYLALCHNVAAVWPPARPPEAPTNWLTSDTKLEPLSPNCVPWRDGSLAATPRTVCAPLGFGANRNRVAVRVDGHRARTVVAPATHTADGYTLCELDLETGHRHQARVHLAWIGMPIVGDTRYGPDTPAGRMMLHAVALDLGAAFPMETQVNTTSHIAIFGPFVSS